MELKRSARASGSRFRRFLAGLMGVTLALSLASRGFAIPWTPGPCVFSIGITPTATTLTYSDGRVEVVADGLIRPDSKVCPPESGGPDPTPTPPPPPPSDPPPVGDPVTPPIAGIPAPCPASTGPSAAGLCAPPRVWKFILNGYDYTPDNEYQPFMRDGQMWIGVEMSFMSKLGLYINESPAPNALPAIGRVPHMVWITTLGPAWRDMLMTPTFTWRNGERVAAAGYYSPDGRRYFIPIAALAKYFLTDIAIATKEQLVVVGTPDFGAPMSIAEGCVFQGYLDKCPTDKFIFPGGPTAMGVDWTDWLQWVLAADWENNRKHPPKEILGGDIARTNSFVTRFGPDPIGSKEIVVDALDVLTTATVFAVTADAVLKWTGSVVWYYGQDQSLAVYQAETQAAASILMGSINNGPGKVAQVLDSARRNGLGRGYPLVGQRDQLPPGVYSVPRPFRNPNTMYWQCELTGCQPGEPVPGHPGWYIMQEAKIVDGGHWFDGAGNALPSTLFAGERVTLEVKDDFDWIVEYDYDAYGNPVNPHIKSWFLNSDEAGMPGLIKEVRNQLPEAEAAGARPVWIFTKPAGGRLIQAVLEGLPDIAGKITYVYPGDPAPRLRVQEPGAPIFPSIRPKGLQTPNPCVPVAPPGNVVLPIRPDC